MDTYNSTIFFDTWTENGVTYQGSTTLTEDGESEFTYWALPGEVSDNFTIGIGTYKDQLPTINEES